MQIMRYRMLMLWSVLALAIAASTPRIIQASGQSYYVSPSGNDAATGLSSSTPFQTIQHAIDLAQPGDIIHLASGRYAQDVVSQP
jgi:hypothetical protein